MFFVLACRSVFAAHPRERRAERRVHGRGGCRTKGGMEAWRPGGTGYICYTHTLFCYLGVGTPPRLFALHATFISSRCQKLSHTLFQAAERHRYYAVDCGAAAHLVAVCLAHVAEREPVCRTDRAACAREPATTFGPRCSKKLGHVCLRKHSTFSSPAHTTAWHPHPSTRCRSTVCCSSLRWGVAPS